MKILVTGGSGFIGYNLVTHFMKLDNSVEFTYYKNEIPNLHGNRLDITDRTSTIELIEKTNPDIVIHTVALSAVDLAETDHSLADSVTVQGTNHIIEGCKITNSKLVYVSTTYVFDGTKEIFYEDDSPLSTTYYGITKYRAEELVKNSNLKYLILRTDQPYFWIEKWQKINSVIRVINTLKSGKILKEITDWYNLPTYVPDFVNATEKLIENNEKGIFHLTGSEYIDRFHWSLKVAEIFHLDKNLIIPINSNDLNLPAKRSNVNVSNKKIFEKTGIKMKDIQSGLLSMASF